MSFGNSSGGRGSYERKNVRRKKQSFHTHKVRVANVADQQGNGLATLKAKVIVSLAHLGEQKFSVEPGGYTFANWMKNFNLLLDDFEERAGTQNLPKEYFAKRQEVTSTLFKPRQDFEDLDGQLSNLTEEQRKLNQALALSGARSRAEKERSEREQKIRELEDETKESKTKLEEVRRRIALRRRETQQSRGLFRRFVSGLSKPSDPASIDVLETEEKQLVSEVQGNEHKISEMRAKNSEPEIMPLSEDSDVLEKNEEEINARLSELTAEIERLEEMKVESAQLLKERKEVTQALSEAISKLGDPGPDSASQSKMK